MALSRKYQKIFGKNAQATDLSVVGSKSEDNPQYSVDVETIQSLSNWESGMRSIVTSSSAPYLEDHNSLFYVITSQLAYLFQAGIAEWNSQTEYVANRSVVLKSGKIYMAIANNTNVEPEVTASWSSYWLCINYWGGIQGDIYNQTDLWQILLQGLSYNNTTSSAIGGYPLGAILRFFDGDASYLISSLVDNNTEAPTKANIKYRESDTNKKWKCLERVVVKADKDSDGNWYRLYNDNWCEQSGTVTTSVSQSGASTARIDFQFEFEDTAYFFTTEPRGAFDSSGNALYIAGRYGNKSKTFANITSKYIANNDTGVAGSVNYRWYACGYVVEEE